MPRKPIVAGIDSGGGAGGDAGRDLREALARWATGVAVVAVRRPDAVHAMTATAFMPLSVEPPLVGIAIGEHAPLAEMLETGSDFCVSVLSQRQRRWANVFADIFAADRTGFPPAGDPILDGCIAAITCRVHARQPAGDHVLVIGEVRSATPGVDEPPLLYYDRAYRRLAEL